MREKQCIERYGVPEDMWHGMRKRGWGVKNIEDQSGISHVFLLVPFTWLSSSTEQGRERRKQSTAHASCPDLLCFQMYPSQ
jgi:hypothetical protein